MLTDLHHVAHRKSHSQMFPSESPKSAETPFHSYKSSSWTPPSWYKNMHKDVKQVKQRGEEGAANYKPRFHLHAHRGQVKNVPLTSSLGSQTSFVLKPVTRSGKTWETKKLSQCTQTTSQADIREVKIIEIIRDLQGKYSCFASCKKKMTENSVLNQMRTHSCIEQH